MWGPSEPSALPSTPCAVRIRTERRAPVTRGKIRYPIVCESCRAQTPVQPWTNIFTLRINFQPEDAAGRATRTPLTWHGPISADICPGCQELVDSRSSVCTPASTPSHWISLRGFQFPAWRLTLGCYSEYKMGPGNSVNIEGPELSNS